MTKYTCPQCKSDCYTSDPHREIDECLVCGHKGLVKQEKLGIKREVNK